MKRFIYMTLAAAAIFAVLSACGKKPQPLDTSSMPAAVTYESAALRCTADESRIPDYSFVHAYGNEKEAPVWLWSAKAMSGAALVELDYSENSEKPSAGETIYTFGSVGEHEGIILYMQLGDYSARVGFTYSSEGESFLYALSASENGSSPALTQLQ